MLRWTEEQQREYEQRMGQSTGSKSKAACTKKKVFVSEAPEVMQAESVEQTPKQRTQALGRLRTGTLNKTEARYAEHLQWRMHVGEIAWYKFESVRLRLADKTTYTADFFVMLASGELEVHEVKGHWEEDARVKIKTAAEQYPFHFIAVKWLKDEGVWSFEDFSPWYNKESK